MPHEDYPTFIVVKQEAGTQRTVLMRIRKDRLGREYREVAVLSIDDEQVAFEVARNLESGDETGWGSNVPEADRPQPVNDKLYWLPTSWDDLIFVKEWKKL